jgi:hypothetical protein
MNHYEITYLLFRNFFHHVSLLEFLVIYYLYQIPANILLKVKERRNGKDGERRDN